MFSPPDRRQEYSVRTPCHAFNSIPGAFYAWLTNPLSTRAKEDEYLLGFIKQYWPESGSAYGYRKIYLDLQAQVISVVRIAYIA